MGFLVCVLNRGTGLGGVDVDVGCNKGRQMVSKDKLGSEVEGEARDSQGNFKADPGTVNGNVFEQEVTLATGAFESAVH